jgi:flagellar motor switch protein FliM
MPNQTQTETAAVPAKTPATPAAPRQRSVHSCNFRAAGRLSNEDARLLTAIHETFALQLTGILDTYLGSGVEVKLETLDQLPIKDHVAEIPPLTYIVPFAADTLIIAELDNSLVFPIIELLMGGAGSERGDLRDLSEIEEEVMHDVISLLARHAEVVWRVAGLSLSPGTRIKPALIHQFAAPNEKVTILRFGIELGGATGTLKLVFSSEFLNILLAQIKQDQPQKKSRVWSFPTPPIRERILDCEFEVSAELPALKVAVRDLITLQPGSVLKLRAPIRNPGMLTSGGCELFESVPVRNGSQRAAQLGRRMPSTEWIRR